MRLTHREIYNLSTMAEYKLKEYVSTFKHKSIITNDILKKAAILKQEAMVKKNSHMMQKFDDLIESITVIQKQLLVTDTKF